MSVMMSKPFDRMKMEEQIEMGVDITNTESTIDIIPEHNVASGNPTPELTEPLGKQPAEQITAIEHSDASNVKVRKPLEARSN